jgi:hypothetical protein
MDKETKAALEEEIKNVKKGLASIEWQFKFWQRKAGIRGTGNNAIMQSFAQITGQKTTNEEYLKFLEENLKEDK